MPDPPPKSSPNAHFHLITGRLAESAVRGQAARLASQVDAAITVGVVPITVAALITPKWLARHLEVPDAATHVILPGFMNASLEQSAATKDSGPSKSRTWRQSLAELAGAEMVCGPNDCRDLESWLTGQSEPMSLDRYSIEILAEINHAPHMSIESVVELANQLRADGADRIDLGCDPSRRCHHIGEYVTALVSEGHRVSIDTFDASEASDAMNAGASLVLSVNNSNRVQAVDFGCEVVAIPDTPDDLDSLDETIEFLDRHQVAMRLDPILEPIGSGFMASLSRYAETRRRYPDRAMMMGIGNLTELTDVDSAGVNLLLLGVCEELSIGSVLTTQVINWARTSVRECDLSRRLVHHAVEQGVPPKRLSDALVMLRDPKLQPYEPETIEALARGIRDNNYRILAQDGVIHLISAGVHLTGEDPFAILESLLELPQSDNVDASHAFYLGYEMAKAMTALTLGKQYNQDQALHWGHLTQPEDLHRIQRSSRYRTK